MPSEAEPRRLPAFLLDEHYPGWPADELTADGIDVVSLIAHRPALRGADDAMLRDALRALAEDSPPGLGVQPIVWWLAAPPP